MDANFDVPPEIAETVTSPHAYAQDVPVQEAFRWLRANNPVGRVQVEGADPFWMITKHADILEVSRQNDLFLSGERPGFFMSIADEEVRRRQGTGPRTLITMDGSEHFKHRTLTQNWFMPSNIRKLEGRIREIAREHIDRIAGLGECDFVRDIALTYPLRVIMEILGVERKDEALMLRLTQEVFGADDPELKRADAQSEPGARELAMRKIIAEFLQFFGEIVRDRRANPRDDLASVIANGRIAGEPLSEMDTIGYMMIVATAGHDTTSSSTAGAIWGMCEYPETFAAVKADPSKIPGLVEEAIRWTTPVKHFMRTAAADTQLRGRHIAKGDWIWLSYASGDRDEEVFENPDVFDINRTPNRHQAFGYGKHICLGQHLAKLEMRILFEELLPRLNSLEFAGTPSRVVAAFVGGPKYLPIRFQISS